MKGIHDICHYLTSFSIISRSIHVVANGLIPFLFYGQVLFHYMLCSVRFSCSVVSDSATPWTAALGSRASLSITNSQSLRKLMSIELVIPSNHLILCYPLLLLPSIFPSIKVFSSEFFTSGSQSIGVSASASVLPMNIQD